MRKSAVALPLNRRGLVRELFRPVFIICLWVPGVLLGIVFVLAGGWVGWVGGACTVGCFCFAYKSEFVSWWRRTSPVVADASGIDLQGSGPVPWGEIRSVVIDRRSIWLELIDETVGAVGAANRPPWFTSAHSNLLGDGGGGVINVPVRWVDASFDEIATQIRVFAPVPVRLSSAPNMTAAA